MKRTHGNPRTEIIMGLFLLVIPVAVVWAIEVQSGNVTCRPTQWTCEDNPRCSKDLTGSTLVNVLNESCGYMNYCIIPDSVCENNRCKCQYGFYQECNICLKGSFLNEACKDSKQCLSFTAHSVCREERCVCDEDYFVYKERFCGRGTPFADPCSSSDSCHEFSENSECSDGMCNCVPGFGFDDAKYQCRAGALGDDCMSSVDCHRFIANSECQNGTCGCQGSLQRTGFASCQPVNEEAGSHNQESSDVSVKVQAPEALMMQPKSTLGAPCRYDTDCTLPEFVCRQEDYKCACANGFEAEGLTCIRASDYMPEPFNHDLQPLHPMEEESLTMLYDEHLVPPEDHNPFHPQLIHGSAGPYFDPNNVYLSIPPPHGYSEHHPVSINGRYPQFNPHAALLHSGSPQMPFHGQEFFHPDMHPHHAALNYPHSPTPHFGQNAFPEGHHINPNGGAHMPHQDYPMVQHPLPYPPYPPPIIQPGFQLQVPHHVGTESDAAQYWPLVFKKLAVMQQGNYESPAERRYGGEDGYQTISIPASEMYVQSGGLDVIGGGYGYPCADHSECKFSYLHCNLNEYKCDCVEGYTLENSECVKIFKYKIVPAFTTRTVAGTFTYLVKHGNPCNEDSDCISRSLICDKETYTCDCSFGYDKKGRYCEFKYDYEQSDTDTPTETKKDKDYPGSEKDPTLRPHPKIPSNYGSPLPELHPAQPISRHQPISLLPNIPGAYPPPPLFPPRPPIIESNHPTSPYTNPQNLQPLPPLVNAGRSPPQYEHRPPPLQILPQRPGFIGQTPYGPQGTELHAQRPPPFEGDHNPYRHPYRPIEDRPSYGPPPVVSAPPPPPANRVGPPHPPFHIPPSFQTPLLPQSSGFHPNPLYSSNAPSLSQSHLGPPVPTNGLIPHPYGHHRVEQVNGYHVVPFISVCYSNADCARPYTFCSSAENKCVCYKGFIVQGQDCVSASGPYSFGQSYTSGINYEDFCTTDIDCKTPYGVCVNFHCQCRQGYVKRERDCLASVPSGQRGLDDPCTEHAHCREALTFCYNGRCQCARGYIRYGSRCLATYGYLPSECASDRDCKVQHAECDKHRSRCKCLYGYAKYLQSCREAGQLHGQCFPDGKCNHENLVCYEPHQRCKCREGFVEDGLGCQQYTVGSLGSLCIPPEAGAHVQSGYLAECQREFQCKLGKCRCPDGFHKTGTRCSAGASVYGSQCIDALDCPRGKVDCVNGWCGCRPGNFYYQRECVLIQREFGARCHTEAECEGQHMSCYDRHCVCQPGYTLRRYECVAQIDSEYFQTGTNTRLPRDHHQ